MAIMRAIFTALMLRFIVAGFLASTVANAGVMLRTESYAPDLLADIYAPEQAGAGRPAILLIHGGGWGAGGRAEFAELARWFAAQGAVAIAIDYRLSTAGHRWPAQRIDVQRALAWIDSHAFELGIDRTRIAALGGSAGGHLAAWLAVDNATGVRVKAVVSLWGPWDLTLPDAELQPDAIGMLETLLGPGRPGAREASPYFHISRESAPVLLIHGLDDPLVPPSQAQRACARYRETGARCELLELPSEGHGLSRNEDVVRVANAVRAFLIRELLQAPSSPGAQHTVR